MTAGPWMTLQIHPFTPVGLIREYTSRCRWHLLTRPVACGVVRGCRCRTRDPMSKTLPPFSQLMEGERRRWMPLKNALPKADQEIFDRLFDCVKLHIQAGVMMSRPWPFEAMVMAILLERHKQLERLERLLDALEGRDHA
jgi:hypothetical protein